MTMMKKILIAAMLAGSMGSFAVPASAEVVVVREAPPPLREERIPAARHGHVWVNGHWEWRHNHYQWVRGYWVRERHGYVYNAPTWVERNGHWEMQRGRWARGQRDRDGDGIPNRLDDHPNNPNRG
jgi:hypothetical protein